MKQSELPHVSFARADVTMARELRGLAEACAGDLTRRFGNGHWSGVRTLETIRRGVKTREVWVAQENGKIVGTFTLEPKKPGFISRRNFTNPQETYLWLVSLFVHPARQGQGVGRACISEMRRVALAKGARWIRWDAYSAPAGAAAFCEKCGANRIDETSIRGVGLAIFEISAGPA
ncbi:MAG: GNAT family N-acetyltransferase [Planctomycetes bacterium]|nr:GNAT family N-acetyltransferase [Planctomycetota bacterium]